MEQLLKQGQALGLKTLQTTIQVAEQVSKPLLPYYKQVHSLVDELVLQRARPLLAVALVQLAPLFAVIAQLEDKLPKFSGYPVNYVGIAAIVLHVLNYNLVAQLEHKTKLFTKIFGKFAILLNAIYLILSASVRNHYLLKAIETDAGSRVLFDANTAVTISFWVLTFGIFLNLWVLQSLGWKNMFNGDSFGYLLDKPVVDGPFKWFDDPQYFGTTLSLLAFAIKHQSRIGYGLTGVMYLVFSFSVMLIENPHLISIYAQREKKAPKNAQNKEKKNK